MDDNMQNWGVRNVLAPFFATIGMNDVGINLIRYPIVFAKIGRRFQHVPGNVQDQITKMVKASMTAETAQRIIDLLGD